MKKIIVLIIILIPFNVFGISASSYIVMDSDNNRVLEGSNINKQSLIASITKIMTSMVVINNGDLDKKITVSDNVLKSYGSGIYVEPKEEITIRELLYGLMLRSGNDAAAELAYQVGGSGEGFSFLMNNLAKDIGMKNTNFINSSGLEDGVNANISTVYDMALLSSYAIKNKDYREIVGTKKITVKTNFKTYIWHNKNKLLTSYEYCTGGKTGFTKRARRTLVTNASKDNVNLTIVTFNDGNDFEDHKDLYEKYFDRLSNYKILSKGKIDTIYDNTYIEKDYYMSLTKDEYKGIDISINYFDKNVSNIVGEVVVRLGDKEYFKTNIIQKEEKLKEEKSWFIKLIDKLFGR